MPVMAQLMAEADLLDALDEVATPGAEQPVQRLEIFDYAIASTLDVAES